MGRQHTTGSAAARRYNRRLDTRPIPAMATSKRLRPIMRRLAMLLLPLLPGLAAAAPTLCQSQEQAVFSCAMRDKVVSLCASGQGKAVRMQYRFGIRAKPELQYPGTPKPAAGHFLASRTAFSGGGETRIRFRNGRYGYLLFESMVRTGFGPEGNNPEITAGIVVRAPGKDPVERRCTGEADWNWDLFEMIPEEDFDYDAR